MDWVHTHHQMVSMSKCSENIAVSKRWRHQWGQGQREGGRDNTAASRTTQKRKRKEAEPEEEARRRERYLREKAREKTDRMTATLQAEKKPFSS